MKLPLAVQLLVFGDEAADLRLQPLFVLENALLELVELRLLELVFISEGGNLLVSVNEGLLELVARSAAFGGESLRLAASLVEFLSQPRVFLVAAPLSLGLVLLPALQLGPLSRHALHLRPQAIHLLLERLRLLLLRCKLVLYLLEVLGLVHLTLLARLSRRRL